MFGENRQSNNNNENSIKSTPLSNKNEEQMKSKLPSQLKLYESLKEWSDLGQWLLKLQQMFQQYPTPHIPKKKLLCKRLAQCLSPIWNKAIHENALVIYDLVLSNLVQDPDYDLTSDLPLFSLGLFPFFGFASIQCKPMFLQILEKYYYPLGRELLPQIGGLINSIIVGMEDTNEEMMKKVMASLDMACDAVGIKNFFGLMWVSILRSSRCRLGAFKYLMKKWNKNQSLEQEELQIDEEKMPNKSALVVNALLASLEDESTLVKRAALDFMCAHCKIQDKVFNQNEYLVLIEACLILFIKLDHAVVRRVNNWFFADEEVVEEMEIVQMIQEALRRILQEDQSDPLKIIQNWYMQHPETVGMTLHQIGFQLVKYIYHRPQLEKASERLVESIASHSEQVMRSLFESLQKFLKDAKLEQTKEVLNYIDYTLNKLMRSQFQIIGKIEDYIQFQSRTECLQELIVLILSTIMQNVEKVVESQISQQAFEIALDCIIKIKERFDQVEKDKENQSILISSSHSIITQHQGHLLKQDMDVIQNYSDYYLKLSQNALENEDDRLFTLSSQILLKLQLYIMKQGDMHYDEIPQFVHQLFKSMGGTSIQSLCSIQVILELLQQSPININCVNLAEKITNNSYKDIETFPEIESLARFNIQNSHDGPNYLKAIFERLWQLVDYNYHDNHIVEYILFFAKHYPHIFIFVIESSLSRDQDQRRFQIFCRITNSYYKKHPNLITGVGVLKMLNYLEHDNPLLRYNARTWLSEQAHFYFRVIDPLLKRLQELSLQIKDKVYNTELIVDTIKKISLLYTAKEWFVPYIQSMRSQITEESTYLQQIAKLITEFIVVPTHTQETSRINAISAEFFENMLNNITQPQMKTQIIFEYIRIILLKLVEVIENDDPVLQIQILNLVKALLICTKDVQEALNVSEKAYLIEIYQSNLFFLNLITGLKQSKVFYLKARYLNIIVVSIYSLSEILPQKVLTERVSMIVSNLLVLLKNCDYNSNKNLHTVQKRKLTQIEYLQTNQKKMISNYEFVTDNLHTLSQDQHSHKHNGSGEQFEEVMSLSNAIRAIMSYFFQFKYEIKDIESKPNVAGILVDILTFNLWNKKNDKNANQNKKDVQFIQFQDTCQVLLKLFPVILGSFLECWRLQLFWEFLTTKGCIVYEYSQFEEFDKQLKEQLNKSEDEYSDEDQIKQSILQLIQPCAYQFMSQLLSSMITLWQNEYSTNFYADPKCNQNMCKLMELAITLQLPADEFMLSFINTPQVQSIIQYYQKRASKKGVYFFNYDQATFENGILFFLYTYFATCAFKGLKQQQTIKLWNNFLILSKSILQSRHVNTVSFLLEIFYMMSWKFSPKEVLSEFRKELHTQIRGTLNILSEIASLQNRYITIHVQAQERYSVSHQDSNLQLIVPFPPVIYEMYQDYVLVLNSEGEKSEDLRNLYLIQRTLFDPYKQKGLKLEEDDFSMRCALMAIKTLKKLSYITLINTYEASRNERILENTREFMNNIFPLLYNKGNLILIEAASELILVLLKNSKDQLPQVFKMQILDIFNLQEFFKCSARTLKYWTEIIDLISDKSNILLEQLGNNQNFLQGFAGLFTSKNAETMKKIKGFERVCFIIYSGGVDKYQSKLTNLLDAILSVIKDIRQQHDAIVILIIFCIRILVLRLSPSSLQQVFRRIWTYLICMLMQIFDRKGKQANINILLAGLKLIELFSLYQLEEFYFYEWMFVFDYFGMTINMKQQQEQCQISSPYKFIPYVAYQFPNLQSYHVDYETILYNDQLQTTLFKKKRVVKIKDIQYASEFELRQEAVYLCQYLIDINQQRVEASPQSLEALIEAEFISLDDYISQISP